jgi:hypothetical protein
MSISMIRQTTLVAAILCAAFTPDSAFAAPALDGTALRWPWALPFVGILLTIATGPLLFPRLWHHHYGKLAFVWSAHSRSRRLQRSTARRPRSLPSRTPCSRNI